MLCRYTIVINWDAQILTSVTLPCSCADTRPNLSDTIWSYAQCYLRVSIVFKNVNTLLLPVYFNFYCNICITQALYNTGNLHRYLAVHAILNRAQKVNFQSTRTQKVNFPQSYCCMKVGFYKSITISCPAHTSDHGLAKANPRPLISRGQLKFCSIKSIQVVLLLSVYPAAVPRVLRYTVCSCCRGVWWRSSFY